MATQQDLRDAYFDLYNALNDAYWAASTIEDKDLIHGLAEAAFEIMSDLNAADIKSRNDEYANLTKTVTVVNAKLQTLQDQINSIIHNIGVATSVANAASKVLTFASQFRT